MTRNKILIEARQLFYEKGIANVRLQQIADNTGISVGNLAYHYNTKEAIVTAVYEEVFYELTQILKGPLKQKDLSDFNTLIVVIYQFVTTHRFCFNNVWEIARNYPNIQEKWESLIGKVLLQTQKRIDFHVKRKVLKPESYKGAYNQLAQHMLLHFHFWIPQQLIKGKPATLALFKRSLWGLLYPHLMPDGLREYKKYI
jgi:AcrR family transcriptional regulator